MLGIGTKKVEKKTVAGITESLVQIKDDLEILESEKAEELKDLEYEKQSIEFKIDEATEEKTRGKTIFNNISTLLGEPVDKQTTAEK